MNFNIINIMLLLLFASCNSKPMKTNNNDSLSGMNIKVAINDSVYILSPTNQFIELTIDPEIKDIKDYKFIEVEIGKIINPEDYPVTFEIYYLPSANKNDKILLGTFSPFPSDNPGKFIVAAQNKIDSDGKIILSMTRHDSEFPGTLIITVNKINLVK